MSEENVKEYQGTVVWFDARKGYGFVSVGSEGEDLFVHWSNVVVDGFKTLKPSQIVSYELGENHNGRQAINVKVIQDAPEE